MAEEIRVRIAPSPTGKLHIGTARTALFNYLFAKRYGGAFILRIEDTDQERSDPAFTKDIVDSLLWLGMGWDEGPEVGGKYGPYFQMERLGMYQVYIDQLLETGKAYKCFCTPEELEKERDAQQAAKQAPKYSGKCRNLTAEQVAGYEKEKRPFTVRFKVEAGKVEFDDLIKGHMSFDTALFGDFTIVRSDGIPLFVFAVVVDDFMMKISHVLRGEEHLVNAAKHVLLAEAMQFQTPQFGHLPLILNQDKSKMSKRKNPVSVADDYRAKGYLPEALVNFIALLGWSAGDDQEIYTIQQLTDVFEIERVGTSPSIFDNEKLLWMNGYYIRQMDLGDLASEAQNFITDKILLDQTMAQPDFYIQIISLVQERMKLLSETEELIGFFFKDPVYGEELLVAKKSDPARTKKALELAGRELTKLNTFTVDEVESTLRAVVTANDLKAGEVLWSVRVALSGLSASPGVFELLEVFGKEESLKRINAAITLLT